MKFRYTGHAPIKDVDLVLAGIFEPEQTITNNTVFEIPDDNTRLINLIKIMGIYEEYNEPKKVGRPKKKNKEEIEEEQ